MAELGVWEKANGVFLSPLEYEGLVAAANRDGVSVSEYVKRAIAFYAASKEGQ